MKTYLTYFANSLPITKYAQKHFSVRRVGRYLQVTTKIDLVVLWDGAGMVEISVVDETYHSKLCGICGNADGDSSNDMMLPDSEWNVPAMMA